MTSKHQVGLIFGKLYPLHCGHLYLIEKLAMQVDELHVILGYEASRDKQLFKKADYLNNHKSAIVIHVYNRHLKIG